MPEHEETREHESALSDRDRQILDFEGNWQRHAGAKERAIRETFGLSPTRYYQLLNALIDTELALHHDPLLIKRLQRIRRGRKGAQE
ncbi:DUF3263 domain-containing protein [Humidisolicoccus flavus]|uniref:DUF3263 domain-containing protein n=1 Tax=Humidisolicoccus flavus TaxID=3111414 RepID=UPI003247C1F6